MTNCLISCLLCKGGTNGVKKAKVQTLIAAISAMDGLLGFKYLASPLSSGDKKKGGDGKKIQGK